MEIITSVIAWGICLTIGAPMLLFGAFHLLVPNTAWSVYRGWGKLWARWSNDLHHAQTHGALRVVLTKNETEFFEMLS